MRVKHITFNGDTKELSDLIDTRSLKQIYDDGDEVYSLISNGRIPRELIAGLVVEPFQGEAGYIIADKKWLKEIARICKSNDIKSRYLTVNPHIVPSPEYFNKVLGCLSAKKANIAEIYSALIFWFSIYVCPKNTGSL